MPTTRDNIEVQVGETITLWVRGLPDVEDNEPTFPWSTTGVVSQNGQVNGHSIRGGYASQLEAIRDFEDQADKQIALLKQQIKQALNPENYSVL